MIYSSLSRLPSTVFVLTDKIPARPLIAFRTRAAVSTTEQLAGVCALRCDMECISCKRGFDNYTHPNFDPDYPVCDKCWYWHEEYRQAQNEYIKTGRPTIEHKSEYKKAPIPSDIRWAVWERDNYTCQHCGARRNLTVDHVYPESMGGEMTMENAQTLCKPCNSRKGNRHG